VLKGVQTKKRKPGDIFTWGEDSEHSALLVRLVVPHRRDFASFARARATATIRP
jgi:hypothetical protein